jgi:ComF family protein
MLKRTFLKISNFFYPITCSVCGDCLHYLSQNRICVKCQNRLPFIKGLLCRKCGIPLPDGGEHCYICKKDKKKYSFDNLRSVFLYRDDLRKLILSFKYSNRIFLAKDFAGFMYNAMRNYDLYNDVNFIIPVPLNIFRAMKRGYNQAYLIAKEISLKSKIPLLNNILFRKKITKPQFKLSKIERAENIKDSFIVKNENLIKGKTLLLIDDIATTCSTVSACSLALKKADARKICVLTLARD